MSLMYAHAETPAPTAIKLAVERQSSGASTPSTCEGSPQDQLCPSSQLTASSVSANGPAGVFNDATGVQNVMGRYAMITTEEGLLGEGSFSICRRGIDLVTGESVAIKVYKVQQDSNGNVCEATLAKFAQQVTVLRQLQDDANCIRPSSAGKFFVQLLDFSRDECGLPGPDPFDGVMYVITELADHSLKDYLYAQRARGEPLPHEAVRNLARSVVLAAATLHAKGYVHLDLKPENMMMFNGHLKIIDVDGCVRIGSSISLQDSAISFSPCYCAPEWARFMRGAQSEIVADPRLDAWSIGLILCECVTLKAVMRPAFSHFLKSGASPAEAHLAFIDWLGSLETSPVPDCVEKFDAGLGVLLSRGLLACDPDLRLTPAQCLSSHYLSVA